MSVLGDALFNRHDEMDLHYALHQAREHALKKVDKLPIETFAKKTDDVIAEELAKSEAIRPIQLLLEQAKTKIDEAQVEVFDPYRGPIHLMGIQVTKSIPFNGDPQLLYLRPSRYDLNPPHGKVQGNVLSIGKGIRESEGEDAKRHIKSTENSIESYLASQRSQIEAHNNSLPAAIKSRIVVRRERLAKAAALQKELDSNNED